MLQELNEKRTHVKDLWSPEDDDPYYESDWKNDTDEVTLGMDGMESIYAPSCSFEEAA